MPFLLDTNIISEGAPERLERPELVQWLEANSGRLYISTVTVAELEIGIAKARRKRATRKAAELSRWLEQVLLLYSGRILTFDLRAARVAGGVADKARENGHDPDFADLAIASIAKAHGHIILTRNVKHFAPFEVALHDPFKSLPP
jgi:predicted nucleic acid-binding protein